MLRECRTRGKHETLLIVVVRKFRSSRSFRVRGAQAQSSARSVKSESDFAAVPGEESTDCGVWDALRFG
eukprot:3712761-Pleurochrysis_carterae.AAC.1